MRLLALVESEGHVCCRYRIGAFRARWEAVGHTLTIRALGKSLMERWHSLAEARHYEATILQRKLLSKLELRRLRKAAKRLVFDFDDAVWLRDSYSKKGFDDPRRARRFARIVATVDAVVPGNRFLAEEASKYAPRERIAVVPTCLKPGKYALAKHDRPAGSAKLVWVGSSSTLKGIERKRELFDAIATAVPGVRFKVVCDRFPTFDKMPVDAVPWNEATEAAELADADIGIGWVPDDPWSQGKCGLKLLQYQAAGLAVVANPVGVQADIVEHGRTGLLATSDAEWVEAVRKLAYDPQMRRTMGAVARADVDQEYSVEAGAVAWKGVFSSLEFRR